MKCFWVKGNMIELERIHYNIPSKQAIQNYVDSGVAVEEPTTVIVVPTDQPTGQVKNQKMRRQLLIRKFLNYSNQILDFGRCMNMDDLQFTEQCINTILNRRLRRDDLQFVEQLKQGMPHEALVYMLCNRADARNDIAIENFEYYDHAYWRYAIKKKVLRIGFFRYLADLVTMPIRVKKIERMMVENSLDIRFDIWEQRNGCNARDS